MDIALSYIWKLLCNGFPSILNIYQSNISEIEIYPIKNPHTAIIEHYTDKKYNQIELEHSKCQFIIEINHSFANNNKNNLAVTVIYRAPRKTFIIS